MVLVEPKVEPVLTVADRIVIMENGRACGHATVESLARDPAPLIRSVGVRRAG